MEEKSPHNGFFRTKEIIRDVCIFKYCGNFLWKYFYSFHIWYQKQILIKIDYGRNAILLTVKAIVRINIYQSIRIKNTINLHTPPLQILKSIVFIILNLEIVNIKKGFLSLFSQDCKDVNFVFYWTSSLIWEQNFFTKKTSTFPANYLSFFIDLILTFNIFLLGQCHTYFSILQMDLFRQTNIFFLNIIAWGDGGKQRLPPPTSKTSEHHCKTKECSDNYAKKTVYEWEWSWKRIDILLRVDITEGTEGS